jgi:hypothetical protein
MGGGAKSTFIVVLLTSLLIGQCHVSGIPLKKGKIPYAKEKNGAAWLDRSGDFSLKGRKFPLT